ncbi:outer membrane insertion signal domain protein [Neisseria sicca ATCC 29256]|uniref:Outer membrane insertion signal domain protein n=1 Tax=Neisseria sicca ATCC 29256 TaxID=547045 RepID=C6M8A2_NEISI|nr:outer membrane insertion signal domain protein [Neisseria sicca ATCC 29256]
MKKFNVKALSMAVAAAVVSSAAGAAERDLGSIPEKAQNAMAFQTVFGENTKFDEDTGKFTFDKDSSALLLKTMELEQAVNGFAAGSNFVATNEDGSKTVREATNADIAADSMKGVGLAGGITAVNTRVDNLAKDIDEALDEQDKAVDQLVDELKNTIASNNKKIAEDMTAMGEEISGKFNDVDNEISKASSELSESIEKVAGDVTAVNTRVDSLAQDTADAKAVAKAAEDKVTALSANVDGKVKEAKDAADKAVDAASKIDAVTEKADKASKGVEDLAKELEATQKATAQVALATIENSQEFNGFKEGDQIVVTKDDGSKVIRTATQADVNADDFGGLGLKEVAAKHDQSLADLTAETERAKKAAEQAALAAIENAQELNGFKDGDEIVVTDDDGVKSTKKATQADVDADGFGGLGLKEVVAAHDEALGDLTETVNDNSEALVKTAQVVNDISADVKANTAAIETKADKSEVEAAQKAAAQAALATIENAQELNGFKEGDQIVVTKEDGSKVIRTAQKADVEADGFGGLGLKEVVAAHDEALGDLTETVNDNSEALVKTAQVVNDISADVKANTAAIETKADKAAVETSKNAALEAEKSAKAAAGSAQAAQKAADANAAQVETNKADIVTLKTASSQHATDIATLQTASNQHAAGIAKNSARIDSLDKNVANLRKETRQGLAAQAALSGLFQPYSVGKFNVTAALGGFKSDTAVAVGAGYRFNENFAAKAGLAVGTSSGGSASYNVGVNYEW